ncbi:YggT family protein [Leucothrix mucor]|jgi:YggT family protein|uniref:YggT family protein n=1 Tax=Leucothrix mucor TaxID=45248 RepID=UPI0003B32B30|nr:YggT family protein [Leucothrix mucor]
MSVIQQIGLFLVETLLSLYITAVILRFLLGYARADFYNPLSQFLVKITNPVLVPMRRFIPSMGKLDTSAVVLAYALTVVKMLLMLAIVGQSANVFGVLIIALRDLLNGVIWVYIIALILMAVISWIGSANGNPVVPLINSLTAPLLAPIRRVMPPVGMLDLSPMVAMLGLYILQIILSGLF